MKRLNIIGCGNAGRALALLWRRRGLVAVQHVLNRSLASGQRAVEFIGAGRAVGSFAELWPAELLLIAASDEAIAPCCRQACDAGAVTAGSTVFHLSGALCSSVLGPARQAGAHVASLHPVKSFAVPALAAETFAGTFCGLEGDQPACEILSELVRQCGGRVFSVAGEFKPVYHAGTVFACNYLVALMETAARCFERAGIDRATASEILQPIVFGTVENVFRLGTVDALTGPIARGELSVVAAEIEALRRSDAELARLYQALGLVAVELAAAAGKAPAEALQAIAAQLQSD